MPAFTYTAANNQGEIINGELETSDMKAVTDYLNRQELMIISIKKKKELASGFGADFFLDISSQEKITLVKHLTTVIKSGLSLKQGIEIILNDAESKSLKKILTEAKFNLEKGQPLSSTFRNYPKIFSPIFIAFIEAGEVSGTLEKSLEYLGDSMSKEYSLTQKVKGAMVYPAVLIAASIGVIVILMVLVVPKLVKVFSQSNMELPWTTKMIMTLSNFVVSNIYALGGLAAIFIFSFFYFRKTDKVQRLISRAMLALPMVSGLYKKIILARFTRVLGTLLASGVSILQAIDISAEAIGKNYYQDAVKNLKPEISKGVSVGNALKHQGNIFPHMLASMVDVGEKTGKMDLILIDLANFYEEEIDNSLKSVVSLIEPLLLLVMGLIVATIAFSIISPIYQLIGSVK